MAGEIIAEGGVPPTTQSVDTRDEAAVGQGIAAALISHDVTYGLIRFTESVASSVIGCLLPPGAADVTGTRVKVDGDCLRNKSTFTLHGPEQCLPYAGFHRAVTPLKAIDG